MLSALASYAKSWLPPSAEDRRIQDPETPATLGLPNEVLMRVFSNLGDRKDVAACRLVCRDFKELSSPYLITRVILAKRVDTVSKFYDILEHPYFRKHVTELLYDASCYDLNLAGDPQAYADARNWNQRITKDGCDLEARYSAYVDLWDRIQDFSPAEELEDPIGEYLETPDEEDGAHTSVWLKTYHDYKQRYEYQARMQTTAMLSCAVKHAFEKLPRLRHVVFGDFRNLARYSEGYIECCERLFRDTFESHGLSMRNSRRLPEEENEDWLDLLPLLGVIGAHSHANV